LRVCFEPNLNAPQAVMSSALTSFVLGNKNLSLDDVVSLAHAADCRFVLDAAALEKVRKSHVIAVPCTDFVSFAAEEAAVSAAGNNMLPRVVIRAIMLVRLHAILRGTDGIAVDVCRLLAGLLSSNITPCVPAMTGDDDSVPLRFIAAALCGHGLCNTATGETLPTAKAFAAANLTALRQMPITEWNTFVCAGGVFVADAIGAIAVHACSTIAMTADSAASLAAEAMCASVASLDAQLYELLRTAKHAAVSAENMRMMLDGSHFVSPQASPANDPASLSQAPQFHGALRSAIASCERLIGEDMNASEFGSYQDVRERAVEPHSVPVSLQLVALMHALHAIACASIGRCDALTGPRTMQLSGASPVVIPGADDPSDASSFGALRTDLEERMANIRHQIQEIAVRAARFESLQRDVLKSASKDTKAHVKQQAAPTDSGSISPSTTPSDASAAVATSQPSEASTPVAPASEDTALLASSTTQWTDTVVAFSGLLCASTLLQVAVETQYVLAAESTIAATILHQREAREVTAQKEKAAAKAARQPANIPVQHKEAAKKKNKKKDSAIKGIVLGKGTRVFRDLIARAILGLPFTPIACPTPATADENGANADADDVSDVVPLYEYALPTDTSFDALVQRVATLMESSTALGFSYRRSLAAMYEALFSEQSKRRKPRIPKGTRDFHPQQMAIRERVFSIITNVFKRHGAVTIDTPVFELKETLTAKYGEDSKLIYDLADQGGEFLALRYDLTVPFARYVAMNNVSTMKRYQIARVYRRDQPVMTRGRYREFYQCDLDICGANLPRMVPDAEVLKVLVEILDELKIGSYVVKINHRRILDGILEKAGVPSAKIRAICSAIDKLDKEPWEEVRREMIDEKGLDERVADRIGDYVLASGSIRDVLHAFTTGQAVAQISEEKAQLLAALAKDHAGVKIAVEEMQLLSSFLDAMGCSQRFSFDMSLARGLDYYTGVIYEAVLTTSVSVAKATKAAEGAEAAASATTTGTSDADADDKDALSKEAEGTVSVGSIAAGGRYDELVGMFSPSGKTLPAVGVSIGVERVFTIMMAQEEAKVREQRIRTTDTQVLVCAVGSAFTEERFRLCSEFWSAGVPAEMLYVDKPNMKRQIEYALDQAIPVMVVLGEDELARQVVQVKDVQRNIQETVSRTDMVSAVRKIVNQS
jgi:histidyl-tRNA synthetase